MKPRFDEMSASDTEIREHYRIYQEWLKTQPHDLMIDRRAEAEMIFRRVGITFAVYGAKDEDGSGTERLIPFDLIPRIIPSHEWREMEKGLVQRVTALNRFLHDVYHDQEILKAGVVPPEQVLKNAQYRPEMCGVDVPGGVYSHITGVDMVRSADADGVGRYYVLEDNLRVPSGVSYMLEDRKMMMRLFPNLFASHRVEPVAHYPDLLLETLRAVAPPAVVDPAVVRADTGHVQQRLLRARLPGTADGHRTGRRAGPVHARRPHLHAHHAGPAPRGCDLPARRRRLHGPAGLPARIHAGLRRADAGLPRRQPDAGQFHRHGGGRRQVDLPLRAEDDRVLPGRKAHPEQRADLHVPQAGRTEIRARQHGATGGEGSARRGRLRHAGRPGGDEGRGRGLQASRQGQAGQLHRTADLEPVHLPDLRRCGHRTAAH